MIIIYNKLNLILLSLFFLQCAQTVKKEESVKAEFISNVVIIDSCSSAGNVVSLIKENDKFILETTYLHNKYRTEIDPSDIIMQEPADLSIKCDSSSFYLVFNENMGNSSTATYHFFEKNDSSICHTKSYVSTSNRNSSTILGKLEKHIPLEKYVAKNSVDNFKELYSFYGFQEYKEPTISNYYKLVKNNLDNKDSLNIICNGIVLNQIYDKEVECSTHNITEYNDIAYYLEQSGLYNEAVILLQKITKDFPDRTVAHLNLADAYWGLGSHKGAIKAYKTYAQQMNNKGKQTKVPERVYQRMK